MVGLNTYQMFGGTDSFNTSMTGALVGVMEVMSLPQYGGFLCMYFGLYDTNAYQECLNTERTDPDSTMWQWILEFESIVTKAKAGEITVTDAFVCFMGDGLLDALLTGALPF